MAVNYTPTPPTAGQARNVGTTEVQRWADYADTVGDAGTRLASLEAGAIADASDVSVTDTGTFYTGTDAEAVLQELGPTNPESDIDGVRTPIRDETGAIAGYVGYSAGAPGVAIWAGDADGATNYDTPFLLLGTSDAYVQNVSGNSWLTLGDGVNEGAGLNAGSAHVRINNAGDISIEPAAGLLKTFGAATGIDGTATPTTAAELADVLVDLGIIASHTIT